MWQTTKDVGRMTDRTRTSHIRVLGKSMYVLSAGWILSVAWLWFAEVQQHVLRQGEPPPQYALNTLSGGVLPALLLGLCGYYIARKAGVAPTEPLERREWWHAFWWCLVPNLLLVTTVWVMIQESR
jgi:hypothetical protein